MRTEGENAARGSGLAAESSSARCLNTLTWEVIQLMPTRSSRYRFILVDEAASPPVLYRRTRRSVPAQEPSSATPALEQLVMLMKALAGLGRRGPEEPEGWASPWAEHPLSFVLDSIRDAVMVRRLSGEVVYRNRAAAALPVPQRPPAPLERVVIGRQHYERRCLLIPEPAYQLVIEILSEIPEES